MDLVCQCQCNGVNATAKIDGDKFELVMEGDSNRYVYPLSTAFCKALKSDGDVRQVHVTTNTRDWVLTSTSDALSVWAEKFNDIGNEMEKSFVKVKKSDADEAGRLKRQPTIAARVVRNKKRTYLTLEDSVISCYKAVDKFGYPTGDVERIFLRDIRAVQVTDRFLRIITMGHTLDLETDSADGAAAWGQLVENALDEWSAREMAEANKRASMQVEVAPSKLR